MAQVSRILRKALLQALPSPVRCRILERFPNFRKAAPEGMKFIYDGYLGDVRVNIDTHFRVEKFMWTGEFDADLTALIQLYIKPGHVCFDVGANAGPVTLLLAKQVGSAGRVVAIEAAPPTYARLQGNLRLNPSLEARVTAINIGVGSEATTLYWTEESDNPGNGWLSPSGNIPVNIVTLDSLVEPHRIQRLDFMKIDVEGMELAVMQGAKQSLRRFRPLLYFETMARFKNSGGPGNFQRIAEFLASLDYDLFRLGRHGVLSKTGADHLDSNTVAVAREQATSSATLLESK